MPFFRAPIRRAPLLALMFTVAGCASQPGPSPQMALGGAAPAPAGIVEFCRRQPYDCGGTGADGRALGGGAATLTFDWTGVFAERRPAAGLRMTWTAWRLINRVNARINRAITSRADLQTYGRADVWTTPLKSGVGFGDCEDYVLEKRRALIGAGLPASALSIAVVATRRGESHAVLLVDTQHGEYVLDNLTPWVLPWTTTPYLWRKREVAGSASQWAWALQPAPPRPPHEGAAARDILLASAR
jgi:predicted transglutaminase-like cysteine proteinase